MHLTQRLWKTRGTIRVRGDIIDLTPSYTNEFNIRIEMFGDEIERITEIVATPPQADVFFPEYNDGTWVVESREERPAIDDNPAYAFVNYVRK